MCQICFVDFVFGYGLLSSDCDMKSGEVSENCMHRRGASAADQYDG